MDSNNFLTSTSSTSFSMEPPSKPVTTPLVVQKFQQTSSNIAGTSTNLAQSLKELEADLKKDISGRKEYADFLDQLEKQKAALRKRIAMNKNWIENFEKKDSSKEESQSFEQQYQMLVATIQGVYDNAKEFHAKGIKLLEDEFNYHVAFKRHNDTFTGIPFKPK